MVKWENFSMEVKGVVSGSMPDTVITQETVQKPILNQSYVQRINEISQLASMYNTEAWTTVRDIRTSYHETGILSKNDMVVLNKLWAALSFEHKYHPENEKTLNTIKNILGAINGRTD